MSKVEVIDLREMMGLPIEEEQSENAIDIPTTEIDLSQLIPFKNHPFKLYEGERLNDMVESIREHGIIMPLIVRPTDDGKYEILSGHNRANAGKLAGLIKAPVVIKDDIDDEEAMLIVTETNLIQRSFSELSHSEKARILTERHNAIKEQVNKLDLTEEDRQKRSKKITIISEVERLSIAENFNDDEDFYPLDKQYRSNEILAYEKHLSPANVSRYLRIDMLTDELKTRLDNSEIPFRAGVDLSFLNEEEQKIINTILDEGWKMDLKKSELLKDLSRKRNFTEEKAYNVLSGKYFEKPKKAKRPKFTPKFTKNIVEKYVTEDRNIKEVEELIERLLKEHFSTNQEVNKEIE